MHRHERKGTQRDFLYIRSFVCIITQERKYVKSMAICRPAQRPGSCEATAEQLDRAVHSVSISYSYSILFSFSFSFSFYFSFLLNPPSLIPLAFIAPVGTPYPPCRGEHCSSTPSSYQCHPERSRGIRSPKKSGGAFTPPRASIVQRSAQLPGTIDPLIILRRSCSKTSAP